MRKTDLAAFREELARDYVLSLDGEAQELAKDPLIAIQMRNVALAVELAVYAVSELERSDADAPNIFEALAGMVASTVVNMAERCETTDGDSPDMTGLAMSFSTLMLRSILDAHQSNTGTSDRVVKAGVTKIPRKDVGDA